MFFVLMVKFVLWLVDSPESVAALLFFAQARSRFSNGFVLFRHWRLLILPLSQGRDGDLLSALGLSPEIYELEEERCVCQVLNPTSTLFPD